jgi:HK97 family phage portal protein
LASKRSRKRKQQQRARYARTNTDLLVGGDIPSGQPPSSIWWMGDDSPLIQTPGSTLAAVTRCHSIIANTLSAMPWRLLASGVDPVVTTIELPPPRWVNDPMLHRPDSRFGESPTPAALRLARAPFWAQLIRSTIMRGMGYLIFEEGAEGQPLAGTLRVLNPDAVSTIETPFLHRRIGTEPSGYLDTDYDGRFVVGGRPYRMVEFRNPLDMVDDHGCTRGVLEMHAAEFGMAQQAVEYGASTFRSGVPSGYLKVQVPNFSADQASALKSKWLEAHGGDRRSIAVLNSTTEFTPLSMSPLDMALIESRRMSLIDISNMFGVPSYMLGGTDGGSNTYSNAESRNADLMRYSLLPWANNIDDVLTGLLPQGQFIEVSFNGLLRADTKTRYEAYSLALKDGWLTPDEVRTLENLTPLHPEDDPPGALVAGKEPSSLTADNPGE